jgi:PAS domain S-box-containing protein
LDQISIGLAVFDENLRLVFCNSRYPLIRGYPIELCTPGVTLAELFRYNAARGDYGSGEAEVQVAERISQIQRHADVTLDQALSDGRILAASYRPLAAGGLIATYEDVTDIRRTELTLRRDQARYEQVTKAVSEGLYDWNIESNDVQVSEQLNALFDFAEGEASASDWLARVHPDDFASYRAALREHLTGSTSVFDTEYRIRDKANVYRWVQDRGIATRDHAGRAVQLVGAVSDISIRKNAERALRDSDRRPRTQHRRGARYRSRDKQIQIAPLRTRSRAAILGGWLCDLPALSLYRRLPPWGAADIQKSSAALRTVHHLQSEITRLSSSEWKV